MRKFHEFDCPECLGRGNEVRRVDFKRECPWSIMAVMNCIPCDRQWTTYIKDESRITPYDIFDEEEGGIRYVESMGP